MKRDYFEKKLEELGEYAYDIDGNIGLRDGAIDIIKQIFYDACVEQHKNDLFAIQSVFKNWHADQEVWDRLNNMLASAAIKEPK